MGKIKAKKGIFFTFMAITLMAVFILVLAPSSDTSLQKDLQSVRARISSVDSYVSDLEDRYLETILRATTHKTMLSLIFYINATGSYIPNLDAAFSEVMLTGKIGGVPIDSITGKKIMDNSTLTDWNSRIVESARDTLNVNTTIIVNNVTVFQTKPWNIDAALNVNITVKSNVAEWRRNSVITTTISIEGLHDPYFLVNTNKEYTNQVKKSSIPFNQWNITKVREHMRNGTYIQSEEAPSFLMRFTNSIGSSACCGIESFVNPNKINPSDQRESYIDYLFWTHKYQSNCTQLYNITGLWDEFRYFKLDLDNVVGFNITSQDAVRSC